MSHCVCVNKQLCKFHSIYGSDQAPIPADHDRKARGPDRPVARHEVVPLAVRWTVPARHQRIADRSGAPKQHIRYSPARALIRERPEQGSPSVSDFARRRIHVGGLRPHLRKRVPVAEAHRESRRADCAARPIQGKAGAKTVILSCSSLVDVYAVLLLNDLHLFLFALRRSQMVVFKNVQRQLSQLA